MHNFVKPRLAVAAVLALCSQFFANPVLASTDSSKVPQLLLTSANQQYLLAENPAGLLLPAAQSGAASARFNAHRPAPSARRPARCRSSRGRSPRHSFRAPAAAATGGRGRIARASSVAAPRLMLR